MLLQLIPYHESHGHLLPLSLLLQYLLVLLLFPCPALYRQYAVELSSYHLHQTIAYPSIHHPPMIIVLRINTLQQPHDFSCKTYNHLGKKHTLRLIPFPLLLMSDSPRNNICTKSYKGFPVSGLNKARLLIPGTPSLFLYMPYPSLSFIHNYSWLAGVIVTLFSFVKSVTPKPIKNTSEKVKSELP